MIVTPLEYVFKRESAWLARADGNIHTALSYDAHARRMERHVDESLVDECDELACNPGTTVFDWLALEKKYIP